MFRRGLAALTAVSLAFAPAAASAQDAQPAPAQPAPETTTQPTPSTAPAASTGSGNAFQEDRGLFNSDAGIMALAILVAAALTFLATQVGGDDEPASP